MNECHGCAKKANKMQRAEKRFAAESKWRGLLCMVHAMDMLRASHRNDIDTAQNYFSSELMFHRLWQTKAHMRRLKWGENTEERMEESIVEIWTKEISSSNASIWSLPQHSAAETSYTLHTMHHTHLHDDGCLQNSDTAVAVQSSSTCVCGHHNTHNVYIHWTQMIAHARRTVMENTYIYKLFIHQIGLLIRLRYLKIM